MTPHFADTAVLNIGDALPQFEKMFSAVDMFAYGAATWDWARVHYDQAYVRGLGFKDTFVDGQQYGAIFAQSLVDWLGPKTFIMRMKFNFRTLTYCGESVTGTGSIVGLERAEGATMLTISQQLNKGSDLVAACTTVARIAR